MNDGHSLFPMLAIPLCRDWVDSPVAALMRAPEHHKFIADFETYFADPVIAHLLLKKAVTVILIDINILATLCFVLRCFGSLRSCPKHQPRIPSPPSPSPTLAAVLIENLIPRWAFPVPDKRDLYLNPPPHPAAGEAHDPFLNGCHMEI